MIINEKQILSLLRIVESYCSMLHRFGEHKQVEVLQNLLQEINAQQSEELKEIIQ